MLFRYFVDRMAGGAGNANELTLHAVTGLIAAMALTLLADDLLAEIHHAHDIEFGLGWPRIDAEHEIASFCGKQRHSLIECLDLAGRDWRPCLFLALQGRRFPGCGHRYSR